MNLRIFFTSLFRLSSIALLGSLGSAWAQPTVTSITPEPLTGSVQPVQMVVHGSGFVPHSELVLRNLTLGKVYRNRPAQSRESDQIVMTPIFGDRDADWSLEIIDPAGASSGEIPFHVRSSSGELRVSSPNTSVPSAASAAVTPPSPSRPPLVTAGPSPAAPQAGGVEPPYGGSAAFTPAARDPTANPEMTTPVQVSNRDVNRIVCPGELEDAHWSDERPIKVTRAGSNLFVKVQIERDGGRSVPYTSPIDLHVVCDQAVYTLILNPQDVPAVTVRLNAVVSRSVKKAVKEWGALPLEQRVTRLTLLLIKGDLPEGFKRSSIPVGDPRRHIVLTSVRADGSPEEVSGLHITGLYEVSAPGTGIRAAEYELTSDQSREFRETDFLAAPFGDELGVTIDPLRAAAGQPVRLIVVTRSISDVD